MQGVSTMKADEEGSTCGSTTKGAAREKAGTSHQGKGTRRRKETKKSRGRQSSAHGQAMRSATRVEEKLSRRAKKESEGALQKRYLRRGIIMGSRIVYERGSSFVLSL